MTAESAKPERDEELENLRSRLAEAEEALRAIHNGETDGVMVAGARGEQVYTLNGADRAYRQLIETMSEGAATLSADGVILYGNVRLAAMLERPLDQVLGSALRDYLPPVDQEALDAILVQTQTKPIRREINLKASDGRMVPVYLSASCVPNAESAMAFCLVFTDLSEQKHREQIEAIARFPSENPNPVLRLSVQGIVQYANTAADAILSMMGAAMGGMVNAEWRARIDDVVAKAHPVTIEVQAGDRAFAATLAPVVEHGYVNLYGRDITERKQAEKKVARSARLLRTVLDLVPALICAKNLEGRFLLVNRKLEEFYGRAPNTMTGRLHSELCEDEEELRAMLAADREVFESGAPKWIPEETMEDPDGSVIVLDTHKVPFTVYDEPAVLVVSSDITERKQAEAEHEKLQAQFTQAQKMESVGRLAGGVAHDFNNLLMGIMGYTQLCMDKVGPDHPIREWLDELYKDATRSAKLTHQLLAFARKQIIAPKVLDINAAIESMLKLLRRLIGEDIKVTWSPTSAAWPVKMDPVQIDQVLANLCVNARDAISGVGSISIETSNATFDEAYCTDHPGSFPGDYTLLTVSDSGHGMDRETRDHIFEPFFTTKGEGEGTGLGLATVYGIVKQNDGYINVYSEPGHGTTFKIYLPRFTGAEVSEGAAETPTKPPRGIETVLLVEDEKSVRITTHLFLEDLGYTVLVAEDPETALRLVSEHPGEVHLLITDVIMPGMSGRDLADRLLELRPSIKRLFISGFTADVIAQRGILDDGVNFLSKPFGRDQLARKVREVLAGKQDGEGGA